MMHRARNFAMDECGMTGAEWALIVCFALALILLTGVLIEKGTSRAARDAGLVLASGTGKAGEIRQGATLREPQLIRAVSSMREPAASSSAPAPPPPAPAAPRAAPGAHLHR